MKTYSFFHLTEGSSSFAEVVDQALNAKQKVGNIRLKGKEKHGVERSPMRNSQLEARGMWRRLCSKSNHSSHLRVIRAFKELDVVKFMSIICFSSALLQVRAYVEPQL